MGMVFCRGCAKQIHETAPTCPQCGATQYIAAPAEQKNSGDSPWMAIVSLVLGILCVITLFDDSEWDKDSLFGLGSLSVTGFVLGIININKKKPGHGMAIAGLVLSAIGLLSFIGLSVG